VDRVLTIIDQRTEGRTLGLIGEPTVNVLQVNMELDRQLGSSAGEGQGG
jgi:K+-transporting ATPase ATPase C chain